MSQADIALGASILAVLISLVGLLYSRVSAKASERSAYAADAADRRARRPEVFVGLDGKPSMDSIAIYTVRNDGPQDLDSVRVHPPTPEDDIRYPLARVGDNWAPNDVELGPLALNQEARFVLACGPAERLPDFRVRIDCRAGADAWSLSRLLDDPRPPRGPRVW